MFSKDGLRAFHRWTHESLHLVFEHAAALPPGTITEKIPGFGRNTVRDQLVHILSTEANWIAGIQNQSLPKLTASDYATVASLLVGRRRVSDATLRYIDLLSETELNTTLTELPKEWMGPPRSPAFIILHVLTHAFHHKGQVTAMFRLLGRPIGDTDLQRM